MENFNYRPNRNNYYPPSRPNFHNGPPFRVPTPRHRFSRPPFHPYNDGQAPALTPNSLRMLPPHMQPPPMFGPRGSTLPPHLLNNQHNYRPRPPMKIDHRESNTRETNGDTNSNTYWCETCDRDFKTADILETHKSQHQTCNIDGCKFVAHPKVITKHIQMQHSTGLYKKIAKLDTPEDIEKWIAERKKKYPTKVNIDKKKSELDEKIARGEKMGINKGRFDHRKDMPGNRNNFGKGGKYKNQNHTDMPANRNNSGKGDNFKNRGNNHSKKQESKKKIHKKTPPDIFKSEIKKDEVIINMNLRAFRGLDEIAKLDVEEESKQVPIQNDLAFVDEDEPWLQANNPGIKKQSNMSVCSALSALMNTYGSSDEDNEGEQSNEKQMNQKIQTDEAENRLADKNEDIPHNLAVINRESKKESNVDLTSKIDEEMSNPQVNVGNESDDSAPEEIKSINIIPEDTEINGSKTKNILPRKRQRKHNNAVSKEVNNPQEDTKKNDNAGNEIRTKFNKPKTFIRKTPSSLLEKLLATEIRHERNVVLQCIRHIVKNNYFKNVND